MKKEKLKSARKTMKKELEAQLAMALTKVISQLGKQKNRRL